MVELARSGLARSADEGGCIARRRSASHCFAPVRRMSGHHLSASQSFAQWYGMTV